MAPGEPPPTGRQPESTPDHELLTHATRDTFAATPGVAEDVLRGTRVRLGIETGRPASSDIEGGPGRALYGSREGYRGTTPAAPPTSADAQR